MSAKKKAKLETSTNGVETTIDAAIRSELFSDNVIKKIQSLWNAPDGNKVPHAFNVEDGSAKPIQIINYPFSVCVVPNLMDMSIIRDAVNVVRNELTFFEKSNDLYQFHQTGDVANITEFSPVRHLHSIICNDLFRWVEKTFAPTGLKSHVSSTFSSYTRGDRLLCHDDQCEDRHIAFVLYLTEGWTEDDGGSLDLLDVNESGDPNRVVMSLTPYCNNLVLFEVNDKSFHQVSEVISTERRLSINGWFHKADLPGRVPRPLYSLDTSPALSTEFGLEDLMFNKYLTLDNQIDIKRIFIANSELQLDEFFLNETFLKISYEFSGTDIAWKVVGPANVRHYEMPADSLENKPTLHSLLLCLQSRTFMRFLQNITGLDFQPTPKTDITAWQKGVEPSCKVEVQRWLPGSYTLIHDQDPEFHTTILDVFLRIPVCEGDDNDELGDVPQPGHIIYIDKDSKDEECLLHLGYKMNSLCLIFREPGTLRFTKYLDVDSTPFYQIQCRYIPWSPPEDDPNLKHCDTDDEADSDSAEEEYEEIGEVEIGMEDEKGSESDSS